MPENNYLTENLKIDEYGHYQLREGAKWARFLSICGFILSGFVMILAFGASSIISNAAMETGSAVSPAAIMFIYVIAAGINFVLALFLYRFSTKALFALAQNDQDALNDSLKNLKMVFKLTGILVIIYFALIILALVAGIAFVASGNY